MFLPLNIDVVVSDQRDSLGKSEEDPDSRLGFSDDLGGVFPRLALAAGILRCVGLSRGKESAPFSLGGVTASSWIGEMRAT